MVFFRDLECFIINAAADYSGWLTFLQGKIHPSPRLNSPNISYFHLQQHGQISLLFWSTIHGKDEKGTGLSTWSAPFLLPFLLFTIMKDQIDHGVQFLQTTNFLFCRTTFFQQNQWGRPSVLSFVLDCTLLNLCGRFDGQSIVLLEVDLKRSIKVEQLSSQLLETSACLYLMFQFVIVFF